MLNYMFHQSYISDTGTQHSYLQILSFGDLHSDDSAVILQENVPSPQSYQRHV